MNRTFACLCVAAALLGAGTPASASVIIGQFKTSDFLEGNQYAAHSFTTAAGSATNNLAFNFYSDAANTTPQAAGTLYLFSSAYTGAVNAISTAAPGYLDSATASGGVYTFNAATTLQAGTQYWFYSDTAMDFYVGFLNSGTSVVGSNFTSGGVDNANLPYFLSPAVSAAFTLTGTPITAASVPEPASLASALAGLAAATWATRRRKPARS